MVKLSNGGAYLLNGTEIVEVSAESESILKSKLGSKYISQEEAAKNTIAYDILVEYETIHAPFGHINDIWIDKDEGDVMEKELTDCIDI